MEGASSSPLPGHILTHRQPPRASCSETRLCSRYSTAWHAMKTPHYYRQLPRDLSSTTILPMRWSTCRSDVNAVTPESRPPFSRRRRGRAWFWREAGYAKPLNPNSYSTNNLSLLLELAIQPTQQERQLPLLWEARDRLHRYFLSVHNYQLSNPT